MKKYFFFVLVAIDQLANTLTGGYPDETLSSRTYRNARESKGWQCFECFVDALFFWQEYHCENAYYTEINGGHNHEEIKNGDYKNEL